jgi:hypothetical protein
MACTYVLKRKCSSSFDSDSVCVLNRVIAHYSMFMEIILSRSVCQPYVFLLPVLHVTSYFTLDVALTLLIIRLPFTFSLSILCRFHTAHLDCFFCLLMLFLLLLCHCKFYSIIFYPLLLFWCLVVTGPIWLLSSNCFCYCCYYIMQYIVKHE